MNDIMKLLGEFGYLAEEAHDIERDVKKQLTRAAGNDEVDTISFGLETDDGQIVKVYVNAEHAEAFEKAMAEMLGEVDDIEDALNQLPKEIEIVDVEWPKDDTEGDDAEDVDPEADAEGETDGSEVMNSKVYSKENLKKEKANEALSYGEELTQSLIENGQNSLANSLSTVNQHLIYQAILHLGVPELALDKSPYRSAILRGIKDTALELAHTPSMRNTLKIFIKQQAMDDIKAHDDEKHRGDAAKNRHHGDEYRKGMQAAGVDIEGKGKQKDKDGDVKEALNDVATGGSADFWASVDSLLNALDSTTDKQIVQRLTGNQQYKSLVARSAAKVVGRLSAGVRAKLKNLQHVLAATSTQAVEESFTNVDAEALLSTMLRFADDKDGRQAERIIGSQLFKRLMISCRTTIASMNSVVKRAFSELKRELDKVNLTEADEEVVDEPETSAPAAKAEPEAKEPEKKPAATPAPTAATDATDSGISFKVDGASVSVNYQGGSFSLSGESLERALKAMTNKQTLSVQLDGGKFATFSPRGSSGLIKLMGTETKIQLTPPDISAFIDAGGQAVEGVVDNDADAEEVKEAQKVSFEEMLKHYQEWLKNPIGKQSDFFKKFGWSRTAFFDEASERGIDA